MKFATIGLIHYHSAAEIANNAYVCVSVYADSLKRNLASGEWDKQKTYTSGNRTNTLEAQRSTAQHNIEQHRAAQRSTEQHKDTRALVNYLAQSV